MTSARLSAAWPTPAPTSSAAFRDTLNGLSTEWRDAYALQCAANRAKALPDSEWRRVQGCLDAALDDAIVVADAARSATEQRKAEPLLQYVAKPRACVNAANLARPRVPNEAAFKKLGEAYVAFMDSAALETSDPEGSLKKADEAVTLARASGHSPSEARALLVRARLEANLLRRADALKSYEQAQTLAQLSGATRELVRGLLMQAFAACAGGDREKCRAQLKSVTPQLEALDDPWLTTFHRELGISIETGVEARAREQMRAVADAWKAIPGAEGQYDRARRSLLVFLLDAHDAQAALTLANEMFPPGGKISGLRDGEIALDRGQALAGLGRVQEALEEFDHNEEDGRALDLEQFVTDVSIARAELLWNEGRYPELLRVVPSDTPDAWLQTARINAFVELGRNAEASDLLRSVTLPFVLSRLNERERNNLLTQQVVLALATRDEARLAKYEKDPHLQADLPDRARLGALVLRGDIEGARNLLRQRGPREDSGTDLLACELAEQEGRWDEALTRARAAAGKKKATADERIESAVRLAGAELMAGSAPADACGRLRGALRDSKTHQLALWPWERDRFVKIGQSHCPAGQRPD